MPKQSCRKMSHTINGEDLRLLWHEIEYGSRSNKEILRKTTCSTLNDAHEICARRYEVKFFLWLKNCHGANSNSRNGC